MPPLRENLAAHAPRAGEDSLVVRAFRLELASGLLAAGTLAVLELGPALAKKGYGASDLEVALLTSGQSLGLILSFFTAHLSGRMRRVPLVFALQLASNLFLCPVFFLRPTFALGFVVFHVLARICWSMAIPARVVIYRANFPDSDRGRLVGRIRQLQLFLTTCVALLVSILLDWSVGEANVVALLGDWPLGTEHLLAYVVPAAAVVGLLSSLVFRRLHEKPASDEDKHAGGADLLALSWRGTLREFVRVWRADRAFRRYESFFFVFGFANIMSIPLTQIHAVDELDASYFDLAMINVILVHGLMALTMVWWGRLLDRHSPSRLRGILNLIFAVDFLVLFLAPTIGWVYAGRIFRGVAMGGGTLVWILGPLYFARGSGKEAIYSGIHTVLTGVRWSLAPFAGVVLKDWFGADSRPIFLLGCIVLVLTGVAMMLEPRQATK